MIGALVFLTPIPSQKPLFATTGIALFVLAILWMFHRIASAFVIDSEGLHWVYFSRFFGVAVGRRAKFLDLPWSNIASVTLNDTTTPPGVRVTPQDPGQFLHTPLRAGRRPIRLKLDAEGGWLLRGSGNTAIAFVEACNELLASSRG